MALIQTNYMSEIMIRFNEDGTIQGAHKVVMEKITDDVTNEVIHRRQLSVEPVSTTDLQTVLDPVNAELVEQVSQLQAQAQDSTNLQSQVTQLTSERDSLRNQVTNLQNQLTPPVVYKPLSSVQIRMGLLTNGIKESDVNAIIAAIEDEAEREAARIKWEKSDEYHRNNPLIEQIGTALGLSEEQINTMWAAAEKL